MARLRIVDELDHAIDVMMVYPNSDIPSVDESIVELAELAAELRHLPRPGFKARLQADLNAQAALIAAEQAGKATLETRKNRPNVSTLEARAIQVDEDDCVLPTLFGAGYGNFPAHRINFVASFVLHAAIMALVVSSGMLVVQHREDMKQAMISIVVEPNPYLLPPSPKESAGGGGGGDADNLRASKGSPPRFALEQLTPPAVVIRSEMPKLAADATVVGPPTLNLAKSALLGDPMGPVLATASNGTGMGGGIGSGIGGGVGSGRGPGVGPGYGGGIGGGVFRVGGGVSAPRAVYDPDPEYSDEARKAKYQGTVMLWVIIGPDGRAKELRVARSLGMGLDEKAMEAVRKWRFEPAKKDGHPVAVQVNIEVNFHLY
ncbi:MAG TPA: energy transducer TonB [Terriglobales bacterium]|jgi:TonB family protein|nr:energy transducer TonB [Terriglobales bacterium]